MSNLTNREREVVEMLSRGMRPSQIADALCVSHSTIKTHIVNVCAKTGAQGTLDLAVSAARGGMQSGQ